MRKQLLLSLFCLLGVYALQAQPYYYNPDVVNFTVAYGCNNCHGGSSGFFVTSYAGILAGGNDCGPTVVPFNADVSPIIWQIDPNVDNCPGKPNMPLGGPTVSPADVALIREWINTGALESAASACADLVISAYVEGTSFNKCVEIYNGTGADIDLSGYSLDIYNNGNTSINESIALSGVLADGEYYLICHTDFALPGLSPNQTSTQLLYNGNDAIALNNGSANVDVLGQIGIDPGDSWVSGGCSTENATLVKINNGNGCMYGTFSGTTDFTPALGSFYTCFDNDDVSGLNTYTAGCPTIPIPVVADVTICQESPIPTLIAEVATPDLTVNWYDEFGNLLASGLEFTPTEPGNYQAQAIDADGCTSDKASVSVIQLSLPYIESVGITCSPDGATYTATVICGGQYPPFTLSSTDGYTVTPIDDATFEVADLPSGADLSVLFADANGCQSTFVNNYSCIVTPTCPQLSAVGDTELLFCPGTSEGTTLKVSVTDALDEDVQWSNGETGAAITLPNLEATACEGTVFTYTAFIPAGIDCPEVSVTFTLNVLPDPSLNVSVVYDATNCVVSLEGACPQFMVETGVNGGPFLPGVAYNLAPGETADVLFNIYDPTDLCASASLILGDTYTCAEDFAFSGGAIWNDLNGNGSYEEDTETGFVDVAAYLVNADSGDTVATYITGQYGFYYFEFVPTGNYYVQIDLATLPENFAIAGGINEDGQSDVFTLGSGESFSVNIPLMSLITDPCDLLPPLVINTQEINSCTNGTYIVRMLVSGGSDAADYSVLVNDTDTISLAANVVIEIGPYTLGTTYSITATDAAGCNASVNGLAICTVPVNLISFTGTTSASANHLRWVTASETNNQYFTLQRSQNGSQFTTIAQLNGAGNSSITHTYTYTDTQAPRGISYYRLLQTDYNGNTIQAGALSLLRGNVAALGIVSITPVPAQNTVSIRFTAAELMPLQAQLYDVSGKVILSEQTSTQLGENLMQLEVSGLAAGIYFLSLQTRYGIETVKVIKN